MLRNIRENEIGRDRGYLVQACLPELALDIVFAGETESAVSLEAYIRRLPGRLGRQVLRHVGLCAARLVRVVQLASFETHEACRLDLDVRLGDGELNTLITPDRPIEHNPLVGVFGRALDEPVTIADTFRGYERPLGIQAIEYVLEALAFLADEVLCGNLQVVEEQLVGLMIDHVGNRPQCQAFADGAVQVNEKHRHAVRFPLYLRKRRGTRQQHQQVGMPHSRNPYYLALDDVPVAFAYRSGLEFRGIGARRGFRHGHRLHAQFATGDAGQVLASLSFGAVPHEYVHHVHLPMTRT